MIRAIAAIDDKGGIAKNGQIPWNIPSDSQYYKDTTAGSPVIMGRATYEGHGKPLPNRRNIVLSASLSSVDDGYELIHDLETFLKDAQEDIWIIGGVGVYEAALPYCDELYLTLVDGDFDCDRTFPAYQNVFVQVQASAPQHENGYTFTYTVQRRT